MRGGCGVVRLGAANTRLSCGTPALSLVETQCMAWFVDAATYLLLIAGLGYQSCGQSGVHLGGCGEPCDGGHDSGGAHGVDDVHVVALAGHPVAELPLPGCGASHQWFGARRVPGRGDLA